ncbi:formyltransferase family protein [Magnetospirillum sp. SS-4]|uniref:formyltransferase family protein n=1 Tax=Magnetospirillum sp. SS-4 TaxID=2681465 RepID=UPI00138647F1|nr:formyltransferase family protein [Magnetospirillum sp. SS-4]CAA7617712.1 putative WbcV protein [Magnetospirillum sp. SS-4]
MSARIAVLALKPVGEAAFQRLLAASGDAFAVVGACSNTSAEGTWWGSAAIARHCARTGLPFLDGDSADLARFIEATGADMILSIQYSRLIGRNLLDRVGGRALNLHLAPLPAYRGFFGPTHALLRGDAEYGTTMHWMDEGADTGDICIEDRFPIAAAETGIGLYRKATQSGLRLVDRLIEGLASHQALPRTPQAGGGRYWSRNSLDGERRIRDPSDAEEVERKARAFHFPGFEPAYIMENGVRRHVHPHGSDKERDAQ